LWYLSLEGKRFLKEINRDFFSSFSLDRDKKKITPIHNAYNALLDLKIGSEHSFVSEKYLKRYFQKNMDEITQQTGGLIRIPDAQCSYKGYLFAFEIELSLKSKKRYTHIFRFYRDYFPYARVYWLVNDNAIKHSLISLFSHIHSSDLPLILSSHNAPIRSHRSAHLHVFVSIQDFFSLGFSAPSSSLNIHDFS
jgi:hypothetical protein